MAITARLVTVVVAAEAIAGVRTAEADPMRQAPAAVIPREAGVEVVDIPQEEAIASLVLSFSQLPCHFERSGIAVQGDSAKSRNLLSIAV